MHDAGVWPASDSEEDVAAAERAEGWHNFPLFVDPLVFGPLPARSGGPSPALPAGGLRGRHGRAPGARRTSSGSTTTTATTSVIASNDNWLGYRSWTSPDVPRTAMLDWIIRPEGLHRVITQAHERYKLPAIYVTENGASYDDTRRGQGRPRRRPHSPT